MDDEGQPRLACGFDMNTQAFLLDRGALGGVVVIEPCFTDADEFGVLC